MAGRGGENRGAGGPGPRWGARARALRQEVLALALACRDPRTPWYTRLLAAAVVAYALSPVDLIPDFIPVLGYVDDLVLVPAGVLLVRRLLPGPVLAECRARAATRVAPGRSGVLGVVIVVAVWVLLAAAGLAAAWLAGRAWHAS